MSLIGLRRALEKRRALLVTDNGFSLLESVIALMITAGALGAISIALMQTVRASSQARQNQNAVDILNKKIEYVRSLDFSAATEITSDLAGDSNLTFTGGTYYFSTSAGNEPVVAGSVGLIPAHIETATQQGTVYTVKTYITQVADATNASANYRRVTVIVSWDVDGKTRSRRSSSFFTDTRRGLPLPRYTMGTAGTYKTNVGATLALPVKITNVGAPDAFNLSASAPPSGTWTWYLDSNGDGNYSASDLALGDSDSNGAADTGLLQVGASVQVFAVRVIQAGEPATQTVTLSAISAAQPGASTAAQSFSDQVLVNPASCTGCTLTTYFLHNATTNAATTYQSSSGSNTPMSMDKTAPAAARSTLWNYSTDCATLSGAADCAAVPSGRHVKIGGGQTENDRTKVSSWYYSVPSDTLLKGTASITIWVRPADGSASASTITAYIGRDNNNSLSGSFVAAGSGTVSLPATTTAGWQAVTFGVPINSNLDGSGQFAISNNKYLGIRIVASGTLNVRLGYDTTSFNAQAVLPVVSGG